MKLAFDYFLLPASPILVLIAGACLLILLECFPGFKLSRTKFYLTLATILSSMACCYVLWQGGAASSSTFTYFGRVSWITEFSQSYRLDPISLALFAAIGVFTLLSVIFLEAPLRKSAVRGEVFSLVLFVATGIMLLVSADSLLMVFLALEFLSLPTYVLVGIQRTDRLSAEAALKYFLFGSFASVLLVFGIALLYAQFGTLRIPQIGELVLKATSSGPLDLRSAFTLGGLALVTIAVGFKLGVVPFHMWLPDVYQGAPTPITGFMGSGIKLEAFGLATRLFWGMFLPLASHWINVLGWIAILTMFLGNLAAIVQDNLKRMFAYSSIAHAGYLLLAVTAIPNPGPSFGPIYYYLIVYGMMFLGLFAVLSLVENATRGTEIYDISGMGTSHPILSFCLAVFALSAAGIPPTAGFLAKYFVFLEVVRAGHTEFVVMAVISSLIGVYYYLRVLVYLYMKDTKEKLSIPIQSRLAFACILVCMISLFAFTVLPTSFGVGSFLR